MLDDILYMQDEHKLENLSFMGKEAEIKALKLRWGSNQNLQQYSGEYKISRENNVG